MKDIGSVDIAPTSWTPHLVFPTRIERSRTILSRRVVGIFIRTPIHTQQSSVGECIKTYIYISKSWSNFLISELYCTTCQSCMYYMVNWICARTIHITPTDIINRWGTVRDRFKIMTFFHPRPQFLCNDHLVTPVICSSALYVTMSYGYDPSSILRTNLIIRKSYADFGIMML